MIPYCDTPRQSVVFGVVAGLLAGGVSVAAGLSLVPMLALAVVVSLALETAGHAGIINLGLDTTEEAEQS